MQDMINQSDITFICLPDDAALEAVTLSFLICKKLGLETQATEYLAGYITCDKDLEEFSHELVIKTADKIDGIFFKKWNAI